MPSLDTFGDFVKSTGQKIASSPNKIINDAVENTYFLKRMLKGQDVAQVIQSGQKITDRIMLEDSGTAQFYNPNDDLDIQNVDSLTTVETHWRFMAAHYAYTEQEIDLNVSGDPQTYYKNFLKSKRQACETDVYNFMEAALWAAPSNSEMESSNGKRAYSLPALVVPDGGAPTGFTTIHTVNPTLNPNWQNQSEDYDPDSIEATDDGILVAFDNMWMSCKFEAPRSQQDYFESDKLQKMVIATNKEGRRIYQRLTRDANDRLSPANDLGWVAGQVVYNGIPVEYVSSLDTAGVNDGTAMAAGKPWFYWFNMNYLKPIFHSKKYMMETDPRTPERQPFTRVVWKSTYYNLFCQSRRRQGIIVPDDWDA